MVIGLMGFGTIGAGVYEIIKERSLAEVRYVLDIREIGIPELTHSIDDLLNDSEVDTVVEVMGGLHPAYEFVTAALKAGKNVVTANKYLVATFYDELIGLAKENNVAFRCTAAVGGGIGWLTALERAKRAEKITALEGIMNGTTNYILTNMHEKGLSFYAALAEAQALGYAEADPSADIDGLDIMHKLMLSANVAFDVSVEREELPVYGIRNLRDEDVKAFKDRGLTCKILGRAFEKDGAVAAFVQPTLLEAGSMTASVPSNFNLISYDAERSGRMSYYGQGAGRYPTAANVVQDCVDIKEGVKDFYSEKSEKIHLDNSCVSYRYYIRSTAESAKPLCKKPFGVGYLTDLMSVAEMQKHMEKIKAEDDKVFIAALSE